MARGGHFQEFFVFVLVFCFFGGGDFQLFGKKGNIIDLLCRLAADHMTSYVLHVPETGRKQI